MARHHVDDDRHVVVVEERGAGFLAFVLGAVVGAGAALLLAPASGEETQARLRRRVRELRTLAEEKADEFGEVVGERVDQVRTGTRDAIDAGRSALDTARDELEQRLEEARARRGRAARVPADDDNDDEVDDDNDDELDA
jgi:gas vesicle protein